MSDSDEKLAREAEQNRIWSIDSAVSTGIRGALIGIVPAVPVAIFSLNEDNFATWIVLTGWILILGILYAVGVGLFCGWMAHAITANTSVSTNLMVTVMVWVVNLSAWGWLMLIALDLRG